MRTAYPVELFGISKKHGPMVEITDTKGRARWSEFQGDRILCGHCKPDLVPPR